MRTQHKLFLSDSGHMPQIRDESIDLIVTSPPYPMIKMWDSFFSKKNPRIGRALLEENGKKAFKLMHRELDKTWLESFRALKPGGIACVNIGDAVRTLKGRFQLYSNHSRIVHVFDSMGFQALPMILWHKKTNAPNKFMGSGMLPAAAYVTLEHEAILLFRKKGKRSFKTKKEKSLRRQSAFFWEERNKWFSDIWFDLPGAPQNTGRPGLRIRPAAFPLELPFRMICMHSAQMDTVLDPFGGAGTAALAAMALGRNSVSVEIESSLQKYALERLTKAKDGLNRRILQRLADHARFAEDYVLKKGPMRHKSLSYGFPVMTAHETAIQLPFLKSVRPAGKNRVSAGHSLKIPAALLFEEEGEKAFFSRRPPAAGCRAGGRPKQPLFERAGVKQA